jgi:hypothetical protein
VWKELSKWDPDSKQMSMFAPGKASLEELCLSFGGEGVDFEGLKQAMATVPQGSGVPVVLDIETGQGESRVRTGILTPEPRAMVREVERFLGRRAYYGSDADLGSR